MHSEMGPVRQNPIQRTVYKNSSSKCAYNCAESFNTQYNTEQFW